MSSNFPENGQRRKKKAGKKKYRFPGSGLRGFIFPVSAVIFDLAQFHNFIHQLGETKWIPSLTLPGYARRGPFERGKKKNPAPRKEYFFSCFFFWHLNNHRQDVPTVARSIFLIIFLFFRQYDREWEQRRKQRTFLRTRKGGKRAS